MNAIIRTTSTNYIKLSKQANEPSNQPTNTHAERHIGFVVLLFIQRFWIFSVFFFFFCYDNMKRNLKPISYTKLLYTMSKKYWKLQKHKLTQCCELNNNTNQKIIFPKNIFSVKNWKNINLITTAPIPLKF